MRARKTDPLSSHKAGAKVDSLRHELIVKGVLRRARKPLTLHEIAERCELSYHQTARRVCYIAQKTMIGDEHYLRECSTGKPRGKVCEYSLSGMVL